MPSYLIKNVSRMAHTKAKRYAAPGRVVRSLILSDPPYGQFRVPPGRTMIITDDMFEGNKEHLQTKYEHGACEVYALGAGDEILDMLTFDSSAPAPAPVKEAPVEEAPAEEPVEEVEEEPEAEEPEEEEVEEEEEEELEEEEEAPEEEEEEEEEEEASLEDLMEYRKAELQGLCDSRGIAYEDRDTKAMLAEKLLGEDE